jgi:putative transposase
MRVYPTRSQRMLLGRLYGSARFVWNWALARRKELYASEGRYLGWVELSAQFTVLRRAETTAWLSELPREPFAQVLRDQERAFKNFFAGRGCYPRFRRRGGKSSVRFTLDQRRSQVRRGEGQERWAYVSLPGLGHLKLRRTEALLGRLRSITLSRDGAGRYFGSMTADGVELPELEHGANELVAARANSLEPEKVPDTLKVVGVDRGLRDLLVVHDGVEAHRVRAPKSLSMHLARLRRYQRRQSRQLAAQMRSQGLDPAKPCPKGVRLGCSRRRSRTQLRIARLHARVGDLRRDTLHRATTSMVREAQVISIEGLRIAAMARSMGRCAFRRSVADAALGEVRRELTYKSAWMRRELIVVDAFFPSSKRCSSCGGFNRALKLEKHWCCPACGAEHDRDENAAKNLRVEALRILAERSTPTGERPGSDARGVESAAEEVRQSTAVPPQRRPTMNREPARRSSRTETARAPSGTARRAVRAGL